MERVIANWQISVQRVGRGPKREQLGPLPEHPVERLARRGRQQQTYEQQRAQVHNWFMLHGGR